MTSLDEAQSSASVWQTYKVPIILGGVSLLLIVTSIYLLIKTYQSPEPIQFSTDTKDEATGSAAGQELLIDVSGAVVKPNVYRLPFGSRVDDAITAAGGMTKDADTEKIATTINRAAKLSDGAKVYIPKKNDSVSVKGIETNVIIHTVSINTASPSDLEELSGIGPALSAKIINARPYTRIEELVEKKIISQSLFEKLKTQLTL